MKRLDRILQRWRISKARPFLKAGVRVLDIGCADGVLFEQFSDLIADGVGIDPYVEPGDDGRVRLIRGIFPADLNGEKDFDVITMFAVAEHIPDELQASFAASCAAVLRDGGKIIITVPSPLVDHLLHFLKFIRIIDGMSLEEHHGFDVRKTPEVFSVPGIRLVAHKRFQLGLNNLFVLEKA